jgi:hypothetical protein
MGKGGESRNNKSVEVEHHGSPVPIALIENQSCCGMMDLCRLIGWTVVDLLRSLARLEAEIWALAASKRPAAGCSKKSPSVPIDIRWSLPVVP